jgi:hypothetical protein
MSNKTKQLVTKQIEHPLENYFEIDPGSTLVERVEQVTTDLVVSPLYDNKDAEIDSDIQEVYDKAMSGHERIQDEMDSVEARYIPRMAEVSVQHLNMALNALNVKARIKEYKDKLTAKKTAPPQTVNQNLHITRNDLMEMLRNKDEKKE